MTNGFKVKISNDKFYLIEAKKISWLFWKNMRMELEILAVEKTRVRVSSKIYRFIRRQPKLENKYIKKIENYFDLPA